MQRTHARNALSVALIVAAASTACGAEKDEAAGASVAAIINGSNSSAAQDETILLARYQQSGALIQIERCTGTLVAPNLVLTARHCVSKTDDNAAGCKANGVHEDFLPSSLHVFVGSAAPGDLRKAATYDKAAARGKKILTDGGTNLCGHDIALLVLDRPIPNAKIAPIRLERKPGVGEPFTAVGWGMTEDSNSGNKSTEPAVRQQRAGLTISVIGPSTSPTELTAVDFQTGESICAGDSGGPALSDTSHAIIGVVSRGGNGSLLGDPAACIGNKTVNVYTQTAPFKSLILQAFTEAGAIPWAEDGPDPRKATFGQACQGPDDCQSSLCYQGSCSLDCFSAACPGGYECSLEGDVKICKAPPSGGGPGPGPNNPSAPSSDSTSIEGGSCAASPRPAPFTYGAAACAALAFALLARRRR